MIQESLLKLYTRDLNAIKKELESYNNASLIWKVDKDVTNSAGNLALHIVGNLNHFIGAILGDTDYIRQRDLEFSQKDIPLKELSIKLDDTIIVVEKTLSNLTPADFQKEYKRNPIEAYMTTEFFLMYLISHLSYHLGQINYHRRLFDY